MKEERREPSHGEGGSNKTDHVARFWYRSACTTGIVRDQPDGQQRNCPGKSIQPHELRKVKSNLFDQLNGNMTPAAESPKRPA